MDLYSVIIIVADATLSGQELHGMIGVLFFTDSSWLDLYLKIPPIGHSTGGKSPATSGAIDPAWAGTSRACAGPNKPAGAVWQAAGGRGVVL